MRILIFTTALFIHSFNLFAQLSYDKGFKVGYAKGYCYNQGVGCISPNPPITPIPKIGESSESYQDGYNRGFQTGLTEQTTPQTRKGYITSTAEPLDYMYKSDESLMRTTLEIIDNRITQNKKYRMDLMDWILDIKQQTLDKDFLAELGKFYNELNSLNPEDDLVGFSKKESWLNEIRIKVKRVLSNYNLKTNQANASALAIKKSTTDITNALENKQYSQAIKLCNNYLENYQSIDVNYYRGYSYFQIGSYDQCIKDMTKCIEVKAHPNGYLLRANSKLKTQDYYGAIADFDKIIELNIAPDDYDMGSIYNDKAYTLVSLKKYNEALISVTKALEITKNKWYIYDTRGEIYYKTGLYKKCIDDMTMAISITNTENANSYYYRGLSKIKIGNRSDGCKDLKKAAELGSSEANEEIKKCK